eukprot:3157571-Karenia_brevis.AAC.1
MAKINRSARRGRGLCGAPTGEHVLDLFAGVACLTRALLDTNMRCTFPVDLVRGSHCDLLDYRVQDEIIRWLELGLIWLGVLGTPCTRWTKARTTAVMADGVGIKLARFSVR